MKPFYKLIAIIATCSLASCTTIYIPSSANMPLLSEKGEAQFGAAMGTNGFSVDGSYAFTDHFGAAINGSSTLSSEKTNDIGEKYKDSFSTIDFSLDYCNIFSTDKYRMELLAGSYMGFAKDKHITDNEYINTNFVMPYIQWNNGIVTPYFDFGVGLRMGPAIHSSEWQGAEVDTETGTVTYTNGTEHFTQFHIEPSIMIRSGSEHVRVWAKMAFSYYPESQSYNDASANLLLGTGESYFSRFVNLSVGMNIKLFSRKSQISE